MSHPFELDISALEAVEIEFEEPLTDEEAARVAGGILPGGCVTTQALGEEGGSDYYPTPPGKLPPARKPPVYTTLALGEEGGGDPYLM